MSKFDKSLESYINDSLTKISDRNSTISSHISSPSVASDVGRTVKIIDDAMSECLGAPAKVRDGKFNNPAMGTGMSNYMMSSGYFSNDFITFNRNELTAIYHGCWVFRKMVDIIARDLWTKGISISTDADTEQLQGIYKLYNKVKSSMVYSQSQARIYGGAAALIMVDDGELDLSKPLNLKNIRKGSPINFIVTDRWYGLEWSSEVVDDYGSSEFGKPKYYSFFIEGSNSLSGKKIHHSRVLRFINRRSPRIIEQQLQGWGISELEHVLQDLMNHENTKNSISGMLSKALLEIVKLEGMRNTMSGLSSGNPQASQMFASQMTALNNYRTSNKMVFMDKGDEYEKYEYSFSGLSEILESQKDIVAGAAEMPEVMLFGTNRAGLNGESPVELRIYSNMIAARQEQEIRPVIDKLLPIFYRICGLEIPEDLTYEFESLLDDTNESKQNALQSITSNVTNLIESGLITAETGLEEIRAVQKRTGFGLKITDRDVQLARETDKMRSENPEGDETSLLGETPEEEEDDSLQPNAGLTNKSVGQGKVADDYDSIKEQIIRATLRDKKKYFR